MIAPGLTFDTGALISLEKRSLRMTRVLRAAMFYGTPIVTPVIVIAEWWRGRSDVRENILNAIRVEPITDAIAKAAGEAIATVRGATPIDAVVMALAASRGDVVYTSDIEDLERLRGHFRSVRVLSV